MRIRAGVSRGQRREILQLVDFKQKFFNLQITYTTQGRLQSPSGQLYQDTVGRAEF